MILPVEVDDALDALRYARERLGEAVDALHTHDAPMSLVLAYTEAHGNTATNVERLSVGLAAVSRHARLTREMDDVEERDIGGSILPWDGDDS